MEKPEIQRAINEAIACFNSGRVERAEEIYREVVAEAPTAGNYADLGLICGKQGKYDEAVLLLKRAVDLQPGSADFHFKLGRTYQRRGSIDDTIRSWQRTIELDPDHVDALSELGSVYLRGRETERSFAFFRKVLEIDPQHYYAHNNLGIAYARQGRMREAIDFHKRAIALRPDYPLAYDSLGSACAMSLRVDDAIASHERAIELEPENGSFHWNYASALLLAGRYDQGWQEYEWRWRTPELGKRKAVYPAPEWHGEDISGKTVVLYGEQGYGDVIQFIRYASSIARRGGTVLVVTQPDLARLLAGASGVSGAICAGDPLGHLDFHFPLLSLPSLFRTTLDTIPSDVPYLRANEALVQAWRARTA